MPAPAATYQLPGDRLGTQSSRHRPPSPHLAPRPCPAALRRVSAAPPRASPGRANTETLNTGGRATTCPRRDAKPRPSPSGLRGPPPPPLPARPPARARRRPLPPPDLRAPLSQLRQEGRGLGRSADTPAPLGPALPALSREELQSGRVGEMAVGPARGPEGFPVPAYRAQ